MECLLSILVKVLFRLSNEATSTTSHTSDVSADSGRVSPPSLSLSASKQNATDLSVLLDAIDLNLAEQGVVVQPKGLCAACSKPIIGRVSNVTVIMYFILPYSVL